MLPGHYLAGPRFCVRPGYERGTSNPRPRPNSPTSHGLKTDLGRTLAVGRQLIPVESRAVSPTLSASAQAGDLSSVSLRVHARRKGRYEAHRP